MTQHRGFPAPWRAKELPADGYKLVDANGQTLAYVYGRDNRRDALCGQFTLTTYLKSLDQLYELADRLG